MCLIITVGDSDVIWNQREAFSGSWNSLRMIGSVTLQHHQGTPDGNSPASTLQSCDFLYKTLKQSPLSTPAIARTQPQAVRLHRDSHCAELYYKIQKIQHLIFKV